MSHFCMYSKYFSKLLFLFKFVITENQLIKIHLNTSAAFNAFFTNSTADCTITENSFIIGFSPLTRVITGL